jgi:hypothetical protein
MLEAIVNVLLQEGAILMMIVAVRLAVGVPGAMDVNAHQDVALLWMITTTEATDGAPRHENMVHHRPVDTMRIHTTLVDHLRPQSEATLIHMPAVTPMAGRGAPHAMAMLEATVTTIGDTRMLLAEYQCPCL